MVIAHNVQLLEAPQLTGATKVAFYALSQGWIGVLLFFVLSGFLITGILLDSIGQPRALGHFMARRALRIFPLYYGALFIIFVMLPMLGAQPSIYKAQAPYQIWLWTYLSNWTDPMGVGPMALPHFWSLAVEEQFYLFWPLVVYALRQHTRVIWACLFLALVGPLSRASLLHAGLPIDAAYTWTFCRIDALAMGAMAATCWRIPSFVNWVQTHRWRLVACVGLAFTVSAGLSHGFARTSFLGMVVGYSGLSIAFAALIYAAADQDSKVDDTPNQPLWQRTLHLPLLKTIGKYSYGMYVIHKPLHDLLSETMLTRLNFITEGNTVNACAHIAAVTVASFLAAWVSYNLYEIHFLRLKRHFV